MSLPTMPRLPRIGRRRNTLSVSEDTPPGSVALDRERATSGAMDATDASAAAPETEEMRRQRTRRVATIIAASLLVSAIASGAATVIARRMRQRARASGVPQREG